MLVTCLTGFCRAADVLVSAVGDQMEFLRLFFDMTFFFFVIIILLAIIQGLLFLTCILELIVKHPFMLLSAGLIIDAFGELREKEETVTDQLKVV